ncbi:hypothetical protein [Massilia soli]|uniref:Lipoprotein n=1 Tax=Massilia soli TaxID=2792854 RepID=A0ABS7SR62_9BURK|nr:hypothetical protein [Massilia soli]MBZ2208434.1 hypothetical protein [Massilia soli]
MIVLVAMTAVLGCSTPSPTAVSLPPVVAEDLPPQPAMAARYDASHGKYERGEWLLPLDASGAPFTLAAEFRILRLNQGGEWDPIMHFCFRGAEGLPASCLGFIKYPEQSNLMVFERFMRAKGAKYETTASRATVAVNEVYELSVRIVGTELIYEINGTVIERRDLGVKPRHVSFMCSTMICEALFFANDEPVQLFPVIGESQ